jgi:WD40 repeat protein
VAMEQIVQVPPGVRGISLASIKVARVLVSEAGQVIARLPTQGAAGLQEWSPDGQQIAYCFAAAGQPTVVAVLTAAGRVVKSIALPGHEDQQCWQLLWSPDGSQLAYSGVRTNHGLTRADDLQNGWTVIDVRTGAVHDVAGAGQPVAWLPGTGAAAKGAR